MTKWKAGDIITTKKWIALSNIYPIAQKIEFYNQNDLIFDIQYTELIDLLQHNVICWFYSDIGNLEHIQLSSNLVENQSDGRAKIEAIK